MLGYFTVVTALSFINTEQVLSSKAEKVAIASESTLSSRAGLFDQEEGIECENGVADLKKGLTTRF